MDIKNSKLTNVNFDQHIRPLIGVAGGFEALVDLGPVFVLAAQYTAQGLGEKDAWTRAYQTITTPVGKAA